MDKETLIKIAEELHQGAFDANDRLCTRLYGIDSRHSY